MEEGETAETENIEIINTILQAQDASINRKRLTMIKRNYLQEQSK